MQRINECYFEQSRTFLIIIQKYKNYLQLVKKNQLGFQGPLRKYTELSLGTFVRAVEARIVGKLADDEVPCSLPVYICFVYGQDFSINSTHLQIIQILYVCFRQQCINVCPLLHAGKQFHSKSSHFLYIYEHDNIFNINFLSAAPKFPCATPHPQCHTYLEILCTPPGICIAVTLTANKGLLS